jgi:SAM-dependent methyltransferase
MMRWFRKPAGDPLAVSMSGIKLGDRLLVVGAADTALIAALAVKVGLTGRACVVAGSEGERARTATVVEAEGALIETFAAPASSLPFDPASFDVVVMRSLMASMESAERTRAAAEVLRVLRPGGRCLVIDGGPRAGLSALLGGGGGGTAGDSEVGAMTAAGFRGVRKLAEREGLSFVEGVKPGSDGG